MADEIPENGSSAAATRGVDPTAAVLGLGRASQAKVDAFFEEHSAVLSEQAEILRLQRHKLEKEKASFDEEQRLLLTHLRFRRFGEYAKAAIEIFVASFLALAFTGIVLLVWQARDANGLIAEPFATPSDFDAKGLNGAVLAHHLLDRINTLDKKAGVFGWRKPSSIAGEWSNDSNVDIPRTGVSLDELSHLLRQWFGNETAISGEVVRTATGIAVTVRAGSNSGVTFRGSEADLDKLLDEAAESVWAQTRALSRTSKEVRRWSATVPSRFRRL